MYHTAVRYAYLTLRKASGVRAYTPPPVCPPSLTLWLPPFALPARLACLGSPLHPTATLSSACLRGLTATSAAAPAAGHAAAPATAPDAPVAPPAAPAAVAARRAAREQQVDPGATVLDVTRRVGQACEGMAAVQSADGEARSGVHRREQRALHGEDAPLLLGWTAG